jgi:hypothetical protein
MCSSNSFQSNCWDWLIRLFLPCNVSWTKQIYTTGVQVRHGTSLTISMYMWPQDSKSFWSDTPVRRWIKVNCLPQHKRTPQKKRKAKGMEVLVFCSSQAQNPEAVLFQGLPAKTDRDRYLTDANPFGNIPSIFSQRLWSSSTWYLAWALFNHSPWYSVPMWRCASHISPEIQHSEYMYLSTGRFTKLSS